MQTSVLRYPKADRFIRVHESLMVACDRNVCAAALIPFFEGWHNFKRNQKIESALYNAMAQDAGLAPVIDVGGWQYHTFDQLRAGVMIYAEDAIRAALKLLEAKGFVDTEVPDHLRILHKTGRTGWYLLRADKINEWFDQYELKQRPKALVFPPRRAPRPKEDAEISGQYADDAMVVFEYRSRRRVEFWKVRGRRVQKATPDAKQLTVIMDRLRENFSVLKLCHAWEGCLASEYHMGLSDKNQTVYDSVGLVYRNAEKVNFFVGLADQAGITLASTKNRLENLGTNAPDPAVYNPYYKQIGGLIAQYLLDTNRMGADASLRNRLTPALKANIPMDTTKVKGYAIDVVERSAGMFGDTHATYWTTAVNILMELSK